jgi:amino acid transporter
MADAKTGLAAGSVGLGGILMQGIATIAPAFAIVSTFVFTVGLAGVTAPLAYLLAGAILLPQAVSVNQLARAFPSAGGWYTWIARSLHPNAGFFAGWYMSLWLPMAPALVFCFVSHKVLNPAVLATFGVTLPLWVWAVGGIGLVAATAYRGIKVSERILIVTGLIELFIMVALAVHGLLSPGPGGFSFAPFDPRNVPSGSALFLAVVMSIFAYSGWEAVAPLAEESKNPKRNVPLGLLGSVVSMIGFLVLTTWGYLVGLGTADVGAIAKSSGFPVLALAQRLWGPLALLAPLAMLNSALAATAACFNGGTRTWYGMARAGSLPAALGKVHPRRQTPDNAIHLMLALQLVGLLLNAAFGPELVFPTWAVTLTLGLITMYVLANVGVIRYYWRSPERNVITHVVFPVISSVAVLYVGYRSMVPLPDDSSRYALYLFLGYTALGGVVVSLRGRARATRPVVGGAV